MKRIISLILVVVLVTMSFEGIGRAETVTIPETEVQVQEEAQQASMEEETLEESQQTDMGEATEEVVEETPTEPELIDISTYSVSLENYEFVYTGKAICPKVTVTDPTGVVLEEVTVKTEEEVTPEVTPDVTPDLESEVPEDDVKIEERNYSIAYENNIMVGTGKVVVKGEGKYTGTLVAEFQIKPFASAPELKSTTSYNKITLSWEKVQGAEGYSLERKVGNGSYKTLKKSTNKKTIKFENTSVKFGNTYTYRLRVFRVINGKTYYSDYSNEQTQKVMVAAPEIKSAVWVTYDTLRITWNKVPGATGYKIYRSTSPDRGYSRIATVIGNSKVKYTDGKCSCGVKYYYKVRAYRKVNGKVYDGNLSKYVVGRTAPKSTQFTSKTSETYTSVSLKWTKSAGAHGYEIYRSKTKLGTYELIKTIKSQKTISYKDSNLVRYQEYYYKIRPYRVVDGEKVYGNYSKIYSKAKSGWHYKNGYRFFYNSQGQIDKDVRDRLTKEEKSQYMIKVNKKRNITTIYAKDPANGKFNTPVVSFICSPGNPTPKGNFSITRKYRWKWLVGPSWGQWSCRFTKGKLFHSVYYLKENDANSLGVGAFNRLGQRESHGCIRLTARDAKWLYDNCKIGTKVQIFESSSSAPFGKPSAPKIPSWHTWDPTDPTMQWKCNRNGCH